MHKSQRLALFTAALILLMNAGYARASNSTAASLMQMVTSEARNTSFRNLTDMQNKKTPGDSAIEENGEKTETQAPVDDAGICAGPHCSGTAGGGSPPKVPIPQGPAEAQQPVPGASKNVLMAKPVFINSMVPDSTQPVNPVYPQRGCILNVNAGGSLSPGQVASYGTNQMTDEDALPICAPETAYVEVAQAVSNGDREHAVSKKIAKAQEAQQDQARGASEAAADGAEAGEAAAITEMLLGLINVANENAAIPCLAQQPTKILPQAIWMVQQMFHQCYVPMAILLLLPGALMTHMKCMVQYGMLGGVPEDEEMRGPSPFTAIFRSIIAVFLIPATQLIVSWMVDIGNSMTYEVEKYLIPAEVFKWMKEQTYNPPTANDENSIDNKPGQNNPVSPTANESMPNTGQGWVPGDFGQQSGSPDSHSSVRNQSLMTQAVEAGFNMAAFSLSAAFLVLIGFQTVMMCYLFLLGPIAAAFYAWPNGVGSLFKKVFVNWVDAVINLSLWRFWWVVVVLIMYVRILSLQALGEYEPNNQWEMAMFAAFMVIICYVPFMPFEFKPGEMVQKVLEKAEQGSKGGGGGGGGGGGDGGEDGASQGGAAQGGAAQGGGATQGGGSTPATPQGGGSGHRGTPARFVQNSAGPPPSSGHGSSMDHQPNADGPQASFAQNADHFEMPPMANVT